LRRLSMRSMESRKDRSSEKVSFFDFFRRRA
jgi:hypothetical protein